MATKPSYEELEQKVRELEKKIPNFEKTHPYPSPADNSPDVICRFDRDLRFQYVNKAVEKLIGCPASSLIGKNHQVLPFPPHICQLCENKVAEVFKTQQEIIFEFTLPSAEGHNYIQSHLVPEFSDEGQLESVLCVSRNITDLREAEEKSKRFEHRLRKSYKMEAIGTLAGGIAHDFNNILTIILGHTEMALDEVPEWNPAHLKLEKVINAGHRAKDLVRNILTFSRMSEGERLPLQLDSIVRKGLKLLCDSLPGNIELHVDITEYCGMIKGNPSQIHQVFMNLCSNAVYAMEEKGGVITVGLKEIELNSCDLINEHNIEPGTYIRLSVSDTGCGIPSDLIEHIFDPYFTTREIDKGSGLGLAVVQGIVKKHGGFLNLKSEPGKGSTFNVFFPKQ